MNRSWNSFTAYVGLKRYLNVRWVWFTSILILHACIEPFEIRTYYDTDLITVDGTITDLPGPQFIRLRRSVSLDRNIVSRPLVGATVEVIVNSQTRLVLREDNPGDYYLPEGFVGQPGSLYQLSFRTTQRPAIRYESTVEKMPRAKSVARVYEVFDPEAVPTNTPNLFRPGHRVYLDTEDPVGVGDYYNWSWTFWESQTYCATCEQGLYYIGRGCVENTMLDPDLIYDYQCDRRCWAIFRNRLINIMSDSYSDGRPIRNRPIAVIPVYSLQGGLLEIRQQALTAGAFQYLKLLADQSQNTGSLADTPPASVFGNVGNSANPAEKLVGYFTAASVSRVRYWLSRTDAQGVTPFGLLGGRRPSPEPPTGLRPPMAPCSPMDDRTPLKPEGWQE